MNKKADILHEHVIFIVLNVVFFSIMLLFIYIQGSSVHLTEEETAKQIALLIDAVKPGTTIEINLKDLFAKAEKEGISKENSIKIDNDKNLVIVQGSKKSFYEYSYFNDINVGYNIKGDYLVLIIK
ncbi:MAG: hypothetical protein Q8N63_04445 [Nanoarchaeota archaeon]|nr:hypothetical protein [Nanoarchaeota archaeon]